MFTPTLVPAKEPCRLPAPIPAPHSFSLYTQMSLWPGSEERWTERPESAQTFCIVIHIPPPCRWLLNLCQTKVEKEICGKVNNLSFSTLSEQAFPLWSLFGLKLLCRADEDRGREEGGGVEGYPKRVGVKNLIALISVLAAHPFS